MNASLGVLATRAPGEWRLFSNLKRAYRCRCKRVIFFENTQCLGCQAQLGYEPLVGNVYALDPGPAPDLWRLSAARARSLRVYSRCDNLDYPAGCNWLVKVDPAYVECTGPLHLLPVEPYHSGPYHRGKRRTLGAPGMGQTPCHLFARLPRAAGRIAR